MTPIHSRLDTVRRQIKVACETHGRDPGSVNLLAVSKTKPLHMIGEAIDAGQHDFGENYLQEALDKIASIDRTDVEWHFIGAIQSNKTRPIAENFDWVHTLASARHARRLAEQRPDNLPPLNVLLQVNISGEDSKAGVSANELKPLIEAAMLHDRLKLRGLMAIPRAETDFNAQRAQFNQLAVLAGQMRDAFGSDLGGFTDLSMGMSGDMEAAIAEGSTWLRIGTAIFGARD